MMKNLIAALLLSSLPTDVIRAEEFYPATRIPHDDLDLGTIEGVRQLDRRISRAILAACSEGHSPQLDRVAFDYCLRTKRSEIAAARAAVLANALAADRAHRDATILTSSGE